MKSIFKVALALSLFTCSISAYAQTPLTSKLGAKVTKKSQLHDGCHNAHAKMVGRPCR
ncbi:hypothetical protein LQG66_30035 [Bradyrhizobium ontarionense]|uniref:Uncharacterized protein n=1 Tax=Bradyrhizobium ontarionense TaxID=2898149 RepID=A0ABY3R857_9BRAD|nr:hypothetical protein [Bradyrhizobium sp. A19]UFZ03426.1 hypothetical protein LQG66_30035 [Bradyrhizobium sp. A19]